MGERGEGRGRRAGGVGGGVAVFEGWGIVDGEFERGGGWDRGLDMEGRFDGLGCI